MTMRALRTAMAMMTAGLLLSGGPALAKEPHALLIGGGEPAGLFLPEAGAVCRTVNKGTKDHGLSCLIRTSGGSQDNIAMLRAGETQLAVVQSRMAADAAAGRGAFAAAGAFHDMRALFSLHGEGVVALVNPESGIEDTAGLAGKRVSLGRPGSFQRLMAESFLASEGVPVPELGTVLELDVDHQAEALCAQTVDAAFFSGIHPMPEVERAIDLCGAVPLIPDEAMLELYLKKNPFYARQDIAAGVYDGVDLPLPTFGPRSLVAARADLPEKDAYAIVKAVFDNLGAFRAMHPLLSGLDKERMARDAAVLARHDGAARYFRENNLP